MVEKTDWDNYAKDVIPKLQQLGYLNKQKINFNINWTLIIIAFIFGALICGTIIYGIATDGFKTSLINNITTPTPQVNISNQYTLSPLTENNYDFKPNHTIIIKNYYNCSGD